MEQKVFIFMFSFLGWFSPLYPFFLLAVLLIFVDTYFGYKVARKQKRVSSRKFSRILYKMLIYNMIIVFSYALDKFILGGFVAILSPIDLTVTKATVFGVLLTELFSIDEKLHQLNGRGLGYFLNKIILFLKRSKKTKDELL